MSDNAGLTGRKKFRQEIEEAMDDPDQWADEPLPASARRSEKRKRAAMISIRLSSEELEAVQAEAANRGQSVGRYVRDRALEPLIPRAVRTAHYAVTNGTSHDLINFVVGEQVSSPAMPQVSAPTLRTVGVA